MVRRTEVVDNKRPNVFVDPKKFSEGKPYKRVRLRVHKKLLPNLMMAIPKGFVMTIHPPNETVHEHEINATFQVNEINPDPKYVAYKADIDSFLANLGRIHSSIRVVKDNLSDKECGVEMPPQSFVDALLAHPGLEGQNDKLRSRAKDVIDVDIPENEVKGLKAAYEQEKKKFITTRLNDAFIEDTGKDDPQTGQRLFRGKIGRI